MSDLAVSAVRQRVATAIGALSGWRQSRYSPSVFGFDTGGGAGILHHSFSVEAQGFGPSPTLPRQRERLSEGVRIRTNLVVQFAHRLRADNQVADYDAGLDAIETIIQTVMGVSLVNLHIALDSVRPPLTSPSGEYLLAELRFVADHRIALQ